MDQLIAALKSNFDGHEALRLKLWNKTPFFGNDDDRADALMRRVYDLFAAIDGRPNTKGSRYHLNMLSTTARLFRQDAQGLGQWPSGPSARIRQLPHPPRRGPAGPAVVESLSKMDQIKSGGTLS